MTQWLFYPVYQIKNRHEKTAAGQIPAAVSIQYLVHQVPAKAVSSECENSVHANGKLISGRSRQFPVVANFRSNDQVVCNLDIHAAG